MRSSWRPASPTRPRSRTTIWPASRTVERRWAIAMVVRPADRRSSAACTWRSVSVSSELVASSSTRIGGFRRIVRAIAIRCFSPPQKRYPRSPTTLSYPSRSAAISSWIWAASAARSISPAAPPAAGAFPPRQRAYHLWLRAPLGGGLVLAGGRAGLGDRGVAPDARREGVRPRRAAPDEPRGRRPRELPHVAPADPDAALVHVV